jgi:hypothetical protein
VTVAVKRRGGDEEERLSRDPVAHVVVNLVENFGHRLPAL